jgi:hypothetical protein
MAYNPAIPQAADLISVSQPQLLANFQQLNTVYGADHYAYNDATANAQRHRQVRLPELGVPPAAAADMGTIYSADGGGKTELNYRYDNGALGASRILQLTSIKAYAEWTNAGVPVVTNSFNVASVTRVTVGGDKQRFTITYTTALNGNPAGTADNYIVLALPRINDVIDNYFLGYQNPTNTTCQIYMRDDGDLLGMSFVVIRIN